MENKEKVFRKISKLLSSGKEFAVVTLIASEGGSPRKSGARMIVFPGGKTEYSVGGGMLEKKARKKALGAIKKGRNINYTVEFKNPAGDMICGGEAEVFIEVFKTAEKVLIFGAGHISLALSKILEVAGLPYIVIDDRKDFASGKRFPGARKVVFSSYQEAAGKVDIDGKTYCVIVTHGHLGDEEVLRSLAGSPTAYIGMIGSVNKVKTVLNRIKGERIKLPEEKIYAPVGLDIGGDSPGEIALAIASEILKLKYGRPGTHSKINFNEG